MRIIAFAILAACTANLSHSTTSEAGENPEDVMGHPMYDSGHCQPGEFIAFQCGLTNNKVVSVCGDEHVMSYRYGALGNVEMTYPQGSPIKHNELFGHRVHHGNHQLVFARGDYRYEMTMGTHDNGVKSGGVNVTKAGKQIADLTCDMSKPNTLSLDGYTLRDYSLYSNTGWASTWTKSDGKLVFSDDASGLHVKMTLRGDVVQQGTLEGSGVIRKAAMDGCGGTFVRPPGGRLIVKLDGPECPIELAGDWTSAQ